MISRRNFLSVHRWLSIGFAAFWIIQALSGMIAVFHWELDDATVSGEHKPTDFVLIEETINAHVTPDSGRRVSSIWTSAGFADRFDINIATTGSEASHVLRVDGHGNILRKRSSEETFSNGGLISLVISLHHNLLAGELGSWIVGISGIILLSNLLLGLYFAWPRNGMWRTLVPKAQKNLSPAWYLSWHKLLGIIFVVPAIAIVTFGVSLAFESALSRFLNAPAASATAPEGSWVNPDIQLSKIVATAQAQFPNAKIAGISYPSADHPVWKVTLNQPSEPARAYGKTRVFLNASDGSVISNYDTLAAPTSNRFMDALFSIHTGEIGGLFGRLITFMVGFWLVMMISLGIGLWYTRRQRASNRPRS
ncbi:PepSY-associated TM helix domain-containing protein [Hyphococcus formosus]|uniref:PepSY-associated TM helix domain-containing protein n=1 Tax=Hyphococcus formosus TaxID=3143534 RepID=UPI00398A77D0